MVSSSAETVSSSRRATSGEVAIEATPWSWSPVAKSRWMTTSCRSRAIRSRSEIRASCWRSATACPRSRASAAWSAKVASISRSLASCRCEVRSKSAARAVTGARWARTGIDHRVDAVDLQQQRGSGDVERGTRRGPLGERRARGRGRTASAATVSSSAESAASSTVGAGPGHGAGDVRDRGERPVQVHRGLERRRRARRWPPASAAPLAQAVGARVVDDEAGGAGEGLDQLLVLLAELLAAALLGEVEVAEDRAPDAHRHPEEGRHRRVVGREADGPGVGREVDQAQARRVLDDDAEDAVAVREVADQRPGRVVDARW